LVPQDGIEAARAGWEKIVQRCSLNTSETAPPLKVPAFLLPLGKRAAKPLVTVRHGRSYHIAVRYHDEATVKAMLHREEAREEGGPRGLRSILFGQADALDPDEASRSPSGSPRLSRVLSLGRSSSVQEGSISPRGASPSQQEQADAAAKAAFAGVMWFYVDFQGELQGPWPSSTMREWFTQGYLPSSTLVAPFDLPLAARPGQAELSSLELSEELASPAVSEMAPLEWMYTGCLPQALKPNPFYVHIW